ncbi:two-component system regulatory protein YycI [Pediococcus inopinatus]|uniref:Two-component system regulatory protein YycI n=1 Tax=Pediococcus inopinatus TaxID=114090 RepID=A0ABZ0Q4A5_9LACO|nr:two-component system regulatory protein YycI [Pediococcus inopinatus]WPC20096.1 two-component system regulatory protein YycI [Pediococcus inopinatus]WPC21801.1 two-component system regulatory protein YycI [Pediococcus inopinatus]WPP09271.1 two-component system regulatory protein YycI [Pediococcus inopinatus]
MDFKRIELIFLAAFAALDIFLVVSFLQNNSDVHSTATGTSHNATILKEMRDDSITFKKPSNKKGQGYYISTQTSGTKKVKTKMNKLAGQSAKMVSGEIISTFNTPISLNTKHPDKTLDKVVKDSVQIVNGKHYQYDAATSSDTQIIYTQEVSGQRIFSKSGQIRFKVNDAHQVVGYTQGYLTNAQPLREKQDTISQERAIIWLYQYNEMPNDTVIKWARLGYTRLLSIEKGSVYVPTWYIAIHGKGSSALQFYRINAFTGVIMKYNTQVSSSSSSSASSASSSEDDSSLLSQAVSSSKQAVESSMETSVKTTTNRNSYSSTYNNSSSVGTASSSTGATATSSSSAKAAKSVSSSTSSEVQ